MVRMWARGTTFLLWAAAAATAVFWALRFFAGGAAVPAHAKPVSAVAPVPALQAVDLSRVLGAEPAPVAAVATPQAAPSDARFQLLGVVASRSAPSAREAVALIAVDGKPARAYRVGAVVSGDTVLRAVHAKGADLGPSQGPVQVSLQVLAGVAGATSPGGLAPPPQVPMPGPRTGAPVRAPFATTPGNLMPNPPAAATPPTAAGRLVRVPQVMPVPQPGAAGTLQNLAPPAEGDVAAEPPQRRRPGNADALR